MSHARSLIILALQSEGVVDEVIERALVKAELYNLESRIRTSVERDICKAQAQAQYGDIFGEGERGKPRNYLEETFP
jgi:hypothetical protein